MSLWTVMNQFAVDHPELDGHQLADAFLESQDKIDIRDLLAGEFANICRGHQRHAEIAHLMTRRSDDRPSWPKRLRVGRVATGEGVLVPFGKMTVTQHKMRIAMLRIQRNGIDRTIRLHEDAVTDIEAAGVTCLDDLNNAAA